MARIRSGLYLIREKEVNRIKAVMHRLYSENRFKDGDEMRDYAQMLEAVLSTLVEED